MKMKQTRCGFVMCCMALLVVCACTQNPETELTVVKYLGTEPSDDPPPPVPPAVVKVKSVSSCTIKAHFDAIPELEAYITNLNASVHKILGTDVIDLFWPIANNSVNAHCVRSPDLTKGRVIPVNVATGAAVTNVAQVKGAPVVLTPPKLGEDPLSVKQVLSQALQLLPHTAPAVATAKGEALSAAMALVPPLASVVGEVTPLSAMVSSDNIVLGENTIDINNRINIKMYFDKPLGESAKLASVTDAAISDVDLGNFHLEMALKTPIDACVQCDNPVAPVQDRQADPEALLEALEEYVQEHGVADDRMETIRGFFAAGDRWDDWLHLHFVAGVGPGATPGAKADVGASAGDPLIEIHGIVPPFRTTVGGGGGFFGCTLVP
jgi:hypothetical protein